MFPIEKEGGASFDEYLNRSKKAASYLRLLNHCRLCKGSCGQSTCRQTFRLLQHAEDCNPNGNYSCEIKGCCTTKKLLAHVAECNAKISVEGDRKALCLVCTLASMPANACSGREIREGKEATPSLQDWRTSNKRINVHNNICAHENTCTQIKCRPYRSSSMVVNSEMTKEINQSSLHFVRRAPFTESKDVINTIGLPGNPQIRDLSLNAHVSRPAEFIVPTMIPKRFRSNTLHSVGGSGVQTLIVDKGKIAVEDTDAYAKEKWLGIDNISRKIRVGQV
jgi:hypothetical protein